MKKYLLTALTFIGVFSCHAMKESEKTEGYIELPERLPSIPQEIAQDFPSGVGDRYQEAANYLPEALRIASSFNKENPYGILIEIFKVCKQLSCEFSKINPYIIGMQLFQTLAPYAADEFNSIGTTIQILRQLVDFKNDNPSEEVRLLESYRLLPNAFGLAVERYRTVALDKFMFLLGEVCLPLSKAIGNVITLNPYAIGIRLFQALTPYARDDLDPIREVVQFLNDSMNFGHANEPEQNRLIDILRFVPEAIDKTALFMRDIRQALRLIRALSFRNDDEAIISLFGSLAHFSHFPSADPYALIIKLLARSPRGSFRYIKQLFKVLQIRSEEISYAAGTFNNFIESILKSLNQSLDNYDSEDFAFKAIQTTMAIMSDVIVPNTVQLEAPEDDKIYQHIKALNQHFEARSFSPLENEFDDLMSEIFNTDRSDIPVYLYEPLGNLLIKVFENGLYMEARKTAGEFYPWLSNYPFEIKSAFLEPIGYQLLFLHQAFMSEGFKRKNLLTFSVLVKLTWDYKNNLEGFQNLLKKAFQ